MEEDNDGPKEIIELVVTRYNEGLEWMSTWPFSGHRSTVYNKGPESYMGPSQPTKIINLPNVGKNDHTYIYHIIENYHNLADCTVFLPGSLNHDSNKHSKATRIMCEATDPLTGKLRTVFIGRKYNDVLESMRSFRLENWRHSSPANNSLNPESKCEPCADGEFGYWYEKKFGQLHIQHVSFFGIMAIHKCHILQHPLSYYKNLLLDLQSSSNPETGHYFERSWCAIFHPIHTPPSVIIESIY
jgi:Protein of unknown function (DUF3431)